MSSQAIVHYISFFSNPLQEVPSLCENTSINLTQRVFLVYLAMTLKDNAVIHVLTNSNTQEELKTLDRQVELLDLYRSDVKKATFLVFRVVSNHFYNHPEIKNEAREHFKNDLDLISRYLVRTFQDFFAHALQQKLKELEKRCVALQERLTEPLGDNCPPICQFAINKTRDSKWKWHNGGLPVKFVNTKYQLTSTDDFERCVLGEQNLVDLSGKNSIEISCEGYIGLILLLMSDDSFTLITHFNNRLVNACETMNKRYSQIRHQDCSDDVIDDFMTATFKTIYYAPFTKAVPVADYSGPRNLNQI